MNALYTPKLRHRLHPRCLSLGLTVVPAYKSFSWVTAAHCNRCEFLLYLKMPSLPREAPLYLSPPAFKLPPPSIINPAAYMMPSGINLE
jgi:hypothetical protein